LAFLEFLEHGLQYVFPPKAGNMRRGAPTAHGGPPLAKYFDGESEADRACSSMRITKLTARRH
jgi:hypothetical protein